MTGISISSDAAVYSDEGWAQVKEVIDYYMENARIIREGLSAAGIECFGGVNAPYIWLRTPERMSSWDFFDKLLNECFVVGTPGSGFGPSGEGYFRLSAFPPSVSAPTWKPRYSGSRRSGVSNLQKLCRKKGDRFGRPFCGNQPSVQ